MFVCEICGYSTKIKCNYVRHQNKKTKCGTKNVTHERQYVTPCDENVTFEPKNVTPKNCNVTRRTNSLMCAHCTQLFKHRSGKCRHQKTCKLNPVNMPQPSPPPPPTAHSQVINNNNTINNNNIDNSTNIVNNNTVIHINNFGNENLDFIKDEISESVFKRICADFPSLLELVHFNDDRPENQTIQKVKANSNLIQVYDGVGFVDMDRIAASQNCVSNLENKLNISLQNTIKHAVLSELLYKKTKNKQKNQGKGVPQQLITDRHADQVKSKEEECYDECTFHCANKLQCFSSNAMQTNYILTSLTTDVNEIRLKYDLTSMDMESVRKQYMTPIYKMKKREEQRTVVK